ncbi:MAG: SPOR domain-containing protein [Pseudomonadota bacterium]
MDRNRWVYYVGFPLVVAVLCAFSYYLGLTRGKQVPSTSPRVGGGSAETVPHEIGTDLTFFKTLKGEDPEPTKIKKAEEQAEREVGKGSIAVQVSAFRDIGKAHEMVSELENRGYSAFTRSPREGKGDGFYRVYVGPFVSKSDADSALAELAGKGFNQGFVTNLEKR